MRTSVASKRRSLNNSRGLLRQGALLLLGDDLPAFLGAFLRAACLDPSFALAFVLAFAGVRRPSTAAFAFAFVNPSTVYGLRASFVRCSGNNSATQHEIRYRAGNHEAFTE